MSISRIVIFLSFMSLILIGTGFYLGLRLISQTNYEPRTKQILWGIHILFVLSMLVGPFIYRLNPQQQVGFLYQGFQWFHYILMGFYSLLFVLTFMSDLISFMGRFWTDLSLEDPSKRVFLSQGIIVSGLALTGLGVYGARKKQWLNFVEVRIPNLDPALEGLKLLQISDLHMGPTIGKKFVQQVVDLANSAEPDIVCLTGDFVDGSVEHLKETASVLQGLKAKYGRYFVTGNHEYYSGAEEWMAEFKRLGFTGLENEHVNLLDGKLCMGGVRDIKCQSVIQSHSSDPVAAFRNAPAQAFKVLLAHQPSSYKEALKAGVNLQLSGHTHGGQFFPWNLVVKLVHKFSLGLYEHEGMKIFVNGGTGYWGPPLRLGVKSEISVLKLTKN